MQINYSVASEPQLIAEHFDVKVDANYKPTYNAHPTNSLPVITSVHPEDLSYYHWGINPGFTKSKGVSAKLLYAPIEDITNKPSLRKNLAHQRCVIIADGFYAWQEVAKKEKIPYRFHLQNNSLFGIAGLWDFYETEEGEMVKTFMMITRESLPSVKKISERMPAILNEDFLIEWLNDAHTADSVLDYVRPFTDEEIINYTVNPKLSDPGFDSKELWKKVPPANQFGNLTLFN